MDAVTEIGIKPRMVKIITRLGCIVLYQQEKKFERRFADVSQVYQRFGVGYANRFNGIVTLSLAPCSDGVSKYLTCSLSKNCCFEKSFLMELDLVCKFVSEIVAPTVRNSFEYQRIGVEKIRKIEENKVRETA